MIPLIDLFAGPGGLCEGFSNALGGKHPFYPVLSIEKDETAHQTLLLRAFAHYFMLKGEDLPQEYYQYVTGIISRQQMFKAWPKAKRYAESVAWCATLGGPEVSEDEFDRRIRKALKGTPDWVLIGGPPCQAYSLAGRSRSIGKLKKTGQLTFVQAQFEFGNDERQTLYKQYLRILAVHRPAVFVMENVVGILSAKVNGERIFPKILDDLSCPVRAAMEDWPCLRGPAGLRYRIFSFVTGQIPEVGADGDFLIRAERYGIPQARHRVILLGLRDDFASGLETVPTLQPSQARTVREVLADLPKMRSHISRGAVDGDNEWRQLLFDYARSGTFADPRHQELLARLLEAEGVREKWSKQPMDGGAVHGISLLGDLQPWISDPNLNCVLNHAPRSHMASDLKRYLFVAAYGLVHNHSPVLAAFPPDLLPAHGNVLQGGAKGTQAFADRFKVQLPDRPSSTVTCHIAKDGHYFIHYDLSQCRSLTVREAARLQTFPDNYYFEGNQTEQYGQVGNAVPPLLAHQLAGIVWQLFQTNKKEKRHAQMKMTGKKEDTDDKHLNHMNNAEKFERMEEL